MTTKNQPKKTKIAAQNRLLDVLCSLSLILLLWPVMALIALLVRVVDGRPVFFTQLRSGYLGKTFRLVKFRTMREQIAEVDESKRVTKLGRWLRKTGLDELPQLFGVLKGDMSVVGPRPLLPEYTALYSEHQAKRLLVKPGITGHAQLFVEANAPWKERLNADVWYAENRNILLDLTLIMQTARYVLNSIFFQKNYKTESFSKFLGNNS